MPEAAPDVIVVGGGIAGLAAAVRLKERGYVPLVLEATSRVGGRMTTDRVDGFAIDTGVTLLGRRFGGMRQLVRAAKLPTLGVGFSLGIEGAKGVSRYRSRNPFDLLLDGGLSLSAKWAMCRLLTTILLSGRAMLHGNSERALGLDRECVADYFSRLGPGGVELLAKLFEPGLRAALGGSLAAGSPWVLMQVIWNTLGAGFWNFDGGVDRLPEALAREVTVQCDSQVREVRLVKEGVAIDVECGGEQRTHHARSAILALPGNQVSELWPSAPEWIRIPVGNTVFSRMTSVHVALDRVPSLPHVGYGFATEPEDGIGVLELEHLRAPGRCPPGKALVSVYFIDTPTFRCLEAGAETLREKAERAALRACGPLRDSVLFVHLIRWPTAIAQFPKGRLTELVRLRQGLADSDLAVDLAGDWLDGVASESAVQTGFQAAERICRRLGRSAQTRA